VAAVECVLAQHPLAPAVDGVDGGLVHPLGCQLQLAGGAGAIVGARIFGDQFGQEIVGKALAAEHGGSFAQACANALAQFGGGGLGEGDHQDLRRQQGRGGIAMPEHQAQIQRGDRPCLARARAGLDQAYAVQWQVQGVE
jgi:hypothetical protein